MLISARLHHRAVRKRFKEGGHDDVTIVAEATISGMVDPDSYVGHRLPTQPLTTLHYTIAVHSETRRDATLRAHFDIATQNIPFYYTKRYTFHCDTSYVSAWRSAKSSAASRLGVISR